MKAGIIGKGRVGMSFAGLLGDFGFDVITAGRGFEEKKKAAEESDFLFVTVPDKCISSVWEEIRPFSGGKLVCHMSGAMTADVFCGAKRRASLHPMMAVADKCSSDRMKNCFYTAEGESADEITAIFPMLNIKKIESGCKAGYHAAAVMASNLVTSLIDMSADVLARCGFKKDEALSAIEAMAKSNLAAVFEKGTKESLTGPLERGDIETVKKHLEYLQGESRDAYVILSKHLIGTAEEKNPDRDYEAVKAIFSEGCVLN